MCGRYATTMGQMTLYGLFAAEAEAPEESVGIVRADVPIPSRTSDAPEPETDTSAPDVPTSDVPTAGVSVSDSAAGETPDASIDLAANRYNIAPTTNVSVVFDRYLPGGDGSAEEQVRRVAGMRWGLVPSWAKDPSVGNRMINARAESIADKPAFRKPLAKRRCLVPASGYFEWRKPTPAQGKSAKKQPFYITPADGSTMAFAGLWEFWKNPDGLWLRSMTIVTTEAVGELADIHDRMPLVLPASEWDAWLDPANDAEAVTPLLSPPSAELVAELELRPISQRVGNVANDDPGLLERV